jgi:REP element-mobilizing transposase RayT
VPQSLASVLVHLVFSTKNRVPLISELVEPELYAYLGDIFRAHKSPLLDGNGTADHVHLLFSLARTIAIADLVEEVKKGSSKWLKTKGGPLAGFSWQNGYGAFSVSHGDTEGIRAYSANQKEHHRSRTFQEEYRDFLDRHGIPYDERYLWD